MATTREQIAEWFQQGQAQGATHLVVVCDTFDHEDYPVYVNADQDVRSVAKNYDNKDMQRVMEVYKLSDDMEKQLNMHRCFNY